MFKYWQGYEIDGSDTSYTILTPEKSTCLEIVKYYLKLKTIDKNKPLQLSIYRKKEKYSVHFSQKEVLKIERSQLELLEEIFSDETIGKIEISYQYVSPNSLYPEIKRQIIDIVASYDEKNKNKQFHNPMLLDSLSHYNNINYDYIEVLFHPKIARHYYECTDDVSSSKYIDSIIKNDFFAIEVSCSMGASFGILVYNLQKISERFPELQIDAKKRILEFDAYFSGKKVYECINVKTNDFAQTIKRMIKQGGLVFRNYSYKSYKYYESIEELQCYNLPNAFPTNVSSHLWQHYDEGGTLLAGLEKDDALDILRGVSDGKSYFSIDEYISYVEKLAKVTYFSDNQFSAYTAVYLDYKSKFTKNEVVILLFLRKQQRLEMTLYLPSSIYEEFCRKYNVN